MTTQNNYDYDTHLRAAGYVDSGLSGSRGEYFILSYKPGAKKKHKLPAGKVEVHVCEDLFEIHTRLGVFRGDDALAQVLQKVKQ